MVAKLEDEIQCISKIELKEALKEEKIYTRRPHIGEMKNVSTIKS